MNVLSREGIKWCKWFGKKNLTEPFLMCFNCVTRRNAHLSFLWLRLARWVWLFHTLHPTHSCLLVPLSGFGVWLPYKHHARSRGELRGGSHGVWFPGQQHAKCTMTWQYARRPWRLEWVELCGRRHFVWSLCNQYNSVINDGDFLESPDDILHH